MGSSGSSCGDLDKALKLVMLETLLVEGDVGILSSALEWNIAKQKTESRRLRSCRRC
jgi:hypothetical protein